MEQALENKLQVKKRPRFSTRLRHYVEGHGLKLSWIAKMINMSYPHLYRLYSGATEPTAREAHAMAQLLRCQVDDLFELEEPDNGEKHD